MNSVRIAIAAITMSTIGIGDSFAQIAPPTPFDGGATSSATTLNEVLVTGEQPGPGLWKVSKGDHVLWIFGSYAPLPKKMTWRSQDIEATLAASQAMLTTVDVKPKIGFFGGLSLLPSLIGYRNNPGKDTLKDVVPSEIYARWLIQKEKYIGRDAGIEKWRPTFAADELFGEAIDQWGFKKQSFPPQDELREQLEKLARKHKVTVINPTLPVRIEKPRAWVNDFKKMHLNDLACFTNTIHLVETDRDSMRMRANAWAIGDIAALRQVSTIERQDACADVFFEIMNSAEAKEHGFGNILAKAVDIWVEAAEVALAKNKSTFAVLPIEQIFWKDGYIATLRAKGYAVEEP